ncbi:pentatricopeptide repeat-containing protein At1g31430-like [Lycium barbarum]|uniref:pentatricopeptide repeat-containing protein At1g31430-like n=1 Tax=Lycium barbarum TaxID=112863 RepID=UPI00293E0E5A|nr:pentatricopeptide repeat-containing protein At1g31430-like [Lycium barbarum]
MHSTIKCKLCNQMLTLPSKVLKPPKPKTLISLLTSQTPKTSPNYHTSFSLLSLLQTYKLFNHFTQILSYAFTSGHFTNPYISSQLLNHSLTNPNFTLTFSHTLFTQIPNPNVFSCNFLIRAYSHSELPEKSIDLYNQMIKKSMVLDNFTFPFVLKACGRLGSFHKGVEVHCVSLKMGFEFDVFVQNSLIYMYFQCGVVEFAYKVFDFMPESVRDVVTWNSVISGFLQCGCCRKAVYMFGKLLRESDVRLNGVSIVSALTACARIGFLDLGKKIHGLILVYGFVMDVFLGSSLVDMYTKCGCLEDAKKVFDRLLDKNMVCWTSMIAGYLKSDMCKEAIELFREMLVAGVKAEPATIACVVSACGHSGALDLGRWVHNYSERSGIEMNVIVKNSLIDMYSKCGLVDKALEVFDSLTNKDIYSWSMIISGLAMNARSKEALQLFSLMEESSEVSPNEVTFLGILSACSHGGFVDEGFYYFEKMTRQYKFSPGVEHYGCLVDLLGRANLLVEAMGFIGSMPIQPDAVIWRSLLFACSRHGNVELAEVAAKKIKQLEPEKCGAHVLLSNVYASACRWKDVKMVRRNMGAEGIQKQPGCSFIEIDGFVHEFLVADRAHCQIDIICDTLLAMNLVLKSRAPELAFLDFKH